jgi:hypothetical protein
LLGEAARADELEKMVDSYSKINKEMLAKVDKVDVSTHKVAEDHARVLNEMDGLKTQLAESEKPWTAWGPDWLSRRKLERKLRLFQRPLRSRARV